MLEIRSVITTICSSQQKIKIMMAVPVQQDIKVLGGIKAVTPQT